MIDHASVLAAQKERRLGILAKTDGSCWYCGCRLTYVEGDPVKPMDFTIDHVKPVASGGGNGLDNLVPACKDCNSRKGDMSLEDFRAQEAHGSLALRRGQILYLKNLGIDTGPYLAKGRSHRFYGEAIEWGVQVLQKAATKLSLRRA